MRVSQSVLSALLLSALAACHDGGTKKAPEHPATTTATPNTPATQLLSIAWTPERPNQYIAAFDLEGAGVEVLAVCHIPFDWTISAAGVGEGSGELTGQAGHGASFVSRETRNLDQLRDLFLVRVHFEAQPTAKGDRPTLAGKATVGAYGPDNDEHEVDLPRSRITLTPASQCPMPKA